MNIKKENFIITIVTLVVLIILIVIFITTDKNIDSTNNINTTPTKEQIIKDNKSSNEVNRIINNSEVVSDELITNRSENNKLNFRTNSSEVAFNYQLITIILSLTTLASIFVSFWLYRWRKVVLQKNQIMVPEDFSSNVHGIVSAVNKSNLSFSDLINQQNKEVKNFSKSLAGMGENIKNMIETYMTLQNALDKQDEEILRHKKGYDAKIFHNFLLRFTRVDKAIKEYIEDGEIDMNGLEDIRIVMEDALEECGVECFSPEIGDDYRKIDGIAANPKQIETIDENKNFSICKVLSAGYRRKLPESGFEIITEAKVSIYIYKA